MSGLLNFIISQGEQFRRARLPSLYSDFTLQRYSNPDGFAANTTAWIEALTKAAQAGLLPSIGADRNTLSVETGDVLLRSLETKEWGRPLALRTVIDQAVSQRKLLPYKEFFNTRKFIHSRKWTLQPWWLFSWGLKQFQLWDSSTRAEPLPTASFVILSNVEEAASKVVTEMGIHSNQVDCIYPMPMFRAEASKILKIHNGLTESDLNIILTYLARDQSKIVYDAEIVKFKVIGQTSFTLSTQDKTIASLKSLIADINLQIAMLSARISILSESAQKAIDNKNRMSALAALRSKKRSETIIMQRSETLAQLEDVYGRIEQAADQVAIIRVMEASTGVLQNLHAQVGGIDKVESVIEGLRDEIGKVDEIGAAFGAEAHGDSVVDDNAIDEELEKLERQANARDEENGALQTRERLASIAVIRETEETQERRSCPTELSSDERAPHPPTETGVTG